MDREPLRDLRVLLQGCGLPANRGKQPEGRKDGKLFHGRVSLREELGRKLRQEAGRVSCVPAIAAAIVLG